MYVLPNPPSFKHSKLEVTKFFAWDHPFTRWMLNNFRRGATSRLSLMLKERPWLFTHLFQIMDCPDKLIFDQCDFEPMFKRSTILYLRPLSLAIYMRRRATIQILMNSGLVDSSEISFAADTSTQSENNSSTDLLQILPSVVAIRRNFFEALPIIYCNEKINRKHILASESFTLQYSNKKTEKFFYFYDVFDYAIEVVKHNRLLPIAKLFDILVFQCPNFYAANVANMFCSKHEGYKSSLFRRLIDLLMFEDSDNRLTLHLIQSMEQLLRSKLFFKPEENTADELSPSNMLKSIDTKWSSIPFQLKDCFYCLALLFKLYEIFIVSKTKTGPAIHISELLSHVVDDLNCREFIFSCTAEELNKILKFIFEKVDECSSKKNGRKFLPTQLQNSVINSNVTINNSEPTLIKSPSVYNIKSMIESINNINDLFPSGSQKYSQSDNGTQKDFSKISEMYFINNSFGNRLLNIKDKSCFYCQHEWYENYTEKTEDTIPLIDSLMKNISDSKATVLTRNLHIERKTTKSVNQPKLKQPSLQILEKEDKSVNKTLTNPSLGVNIETKSIIPFLEHNNPVIKNVTNTAAYRLQSYLDEVSFETENEKAIRYSNINDYLDEASNTCKIIKPDGAEYYKNKIDPILPSIINLAGLESGDKPIRKHLTLNDVDQLIDLIAVNASCFFTEEFTMSDNDSILIEDMLKECLDKREKSVGLYDDLPFEIIDQFTSPSFVEVSL